jgi:chemotaxis protein methyltransferase CheR
MSSVSTATKVGAVHQEFNMGEEDFARLAKLAESEIGIHFAPSKQALLYSRLAKRLRLLQLQSFQQYVELVFSEEGKAERRQMLDLLTTNVTRFFREPHHFEHLKTKILPGAIDRLKRKGKLRIWSAGCSSGQEPYSIALTILSLLPDARSYDVRILATDISNPILQKAKEGRYSREEVQDIPRDMQTKWLDAADDNFEMGEAARSLIAFRPLNLLGAWPMKGQFDIIFCRNVMIYFKEDIQSSIWRKFLPLLSEGSVAYIGHSERVPSTVAHHFSIDGVTTFRRVKGSGA